jgi:PAS domain S-box-containing protein
MLGYEQEELIGKPSHAAWHYKRPDGSPYPAEECPIYAAYKDGANHIGQEVFWRKDGSSLPVDFTSMPIFEQDKVTGAVVTFRDITGRRQAEEERERLLATLSRSNRELEEFAYVASHDLQEPLRMVASYVQLLEKRYKGRLDEKADKFIFYAVDGARRMQKLIDGLLDYSRVTTRAREFSDLDLNTVFNDAVKNLSASIGESKARIKKDGLPVVKGDETQLLQLFQNLIANAVKFRKPGIAPEVRVDAKRTGKEWTFAVRDNGIGIEKESFDRIFVIFQRLHRKEEYPGTGIGLAVCKKIVERHGGRLWVESTSGEGTTFFFTIPFRPGDA